MKDHSLIRNRSDEVVRRRAGVIPGHTPLQIQRGLLHSWFWWCAVTKHHLVGHRGSFAASSWARKGMCCYAV